MDLVSAYFSDGEMENNANTKKAVKKNNENGNSSDDSDALDIVFEKTVPAAVKSQQPKPTSDDIECICLDDSDSDNPEASCSSVPPKGNESFPAIKNEVSKKIDYLNLESSDTDDEQERIQSSVNNLLSSAAILNDIECGPTRPEPELAMTVSLPSCPNTVSPGKKRSSSPSAPLSSIDNEKETGSVPPAVDIIGDGICSQVVSNKKIKPCLVTSNSSDVNVSTVDELVCRTTMYRKDERIVAAYKDKGVSRIPSTLSQTIDAHQKAISSLSWSAVPHSHLFLSSSLDCTIKIWDVYSPNKPIQTLEIPLGVRAAKWSKDGEQIIAGGFGKELHVFDALSGKTHMNYKIHNYISCIAIHPFIEDVILCGAQNSILGFDLRVDSELPVRNFLSKCGEVLDIVFLNKSEFVCSTSVVSRDSADRTIMVWDFNSGAILSNQIFLERYTCPSLKLNPSDSSFVAQTNGDYIASFSSQRPYKMKNKRYMGHKVSGFGIECDISPDGQYIASGDAKGDVYFYNYADTTVVNKLTVKPDVATNRLKWHPVLSSTLVVATYDGQIHLWK